MPPDIEVGDQLAEFLGPALGVAVVRLAVVILRQLGETAFDHRQPGAGVSRLERELDVGPARIVLGQPVDLPGEPEYGRFLHSFHAHLGRRAAGPRHPGRPTRAQVNGGLVAEPGPEALGRGERRPDLARRVGDLYGPLDAIGKSHDNLH